jgi:hypothetical protein
MLELVEVGTYRKVTIVKLLGHNGPPSWSCPSPLQRAKGGS